MRNVPSTAHGSPSPDKREAAGAEIAVPNHAELVQQAETAGRLVEDIVLKNYLTKLADMEVVPMETELQGAGNIRMFRITEMVYQANEHSGHKFASVFNALQNLNCGVFVLAHSTGDETDFYMGIRALDRERTPKSLKETLRNALCGQFPGVKTVELREPDIVKFIDRLCDEETLVASVSCVAQYKEGDASKDEDFVQGLEKLALAMQGHKYTMLILARSTSNEQLATTRKAYETIYADLSPLATLQLTYGTNEALSVSSAFSRGTNESIAEGWSTSRQQSTSSSRSTSSGHSTSKPDGATMALKALGGAALAAASLITAPLTGGASLVAAGALIGGNALLNSIQPETKTDTRTDTTSDTETRGRTEGESGTKTHGSSTQQTDTEGRSKGTSQSMQLTQQNKVIQDILKRIDCQLERIENCESQGMWECAAYFLSESQETAEMAAGTYRALMKGEKSGLELSAINFWDLNNSALPALRGYLGAFVHPLFAYRTGEIAVPVTPAALVSGNELAIQMGLPRKSVCGFPVVEHADFGMEVLRYGARPEGRRFELGKIYSMGRPTHTSVRLDCESLTMHTFVTGSTGSGKSNTVYEIINQLKERYDIPFLVIEPSKGEYKNIFGALPEVSVYGTNPHKFEKLLRINPFRFNPDIHVLEHMDRLVEVFNACWPMYAAMPAVLKDAMQRAYEAAGWDILTSENPSGEVFPGFADLLAQVEAVVAESSYSADSKGDYAGALCTRIRSLCTGINGILFGGDDLSDAELFDHDAVVDLSRVGSMETKALIMGLLILRLNEYRMASHVSNSRLSHVTVLEEAHNLLKRTSTEQSSEGANLLGKAVELLANSIAEMRTYGEAFIIVDQSPTLLDMAAIRNTNTKIILRLPDQTDRELVGHAANLDDDQITELARLECGVAAVYQNDWIEPVLAKINKCPLEERHYTPETTVKLPSRGKVRQDLLRFLLQGRVVEPLELDVARLRGQLAALQLAVSRRKEVEGLLDAYAAGAPLPIWEDAEFPRLAALVAELSGALRPLWERISRAKELDEVIAGLQDIAKNHLPEASEAVQLAFGQALMRELARRDSGNDFTKLYTYFCDEVRRKRA